MLVVEEEGRSRLVYEFLAVSLHLVTHRYLQLQLDGDDDVWTECNAVASHYFPSRGGDSSMAELITIASCSHLELNDINIIERISKI